MKDLKNLVTPFAHVSAGTMMLVGVVTYAAIIGLWVIAPNELIPSPLEVLAKFGYLVSERGLFHETITSLKLNLQATAIAGLLAMLLAYLWVYPVMRPLIGMLENWRFAGLVGIPDSLELDDFDAELGRHGQQPPGNLLGLGERHGTLARADTH